MGFEPSSPGHLHDLRAFRHSTYPGHLTQISLVLSWAVVRVAGFELGCGAGRWFQLSWCGFLVLSWAVARFAGFKLGCGAGRWF